MLIKVISSIDIIVIMISMTTISVTDDVKEKLLKVASELQLQRGHRVDLNEALSFLIDKREKNIDLLEEACKPTGGSADALNELETERKQDELRFERKIGHRHQRAN